MDIYDTAEWTPRMLLQVEPLGLPAIPPGEDTERSRTTLPAFLTPPSRPSVNAFAVNPAFELGRGFRVCA